jgi:hypothetical protein
VKGIWFVLIWIVCVIIGALGGWWLGGLLWQMGFELIGSSVALVGAGVGGILVFLAFLRWYEDRQA